jgi:hypothetical protein
MPEYLRIEVNNFKWLVEDTEDLSTRRGGSLLALDLVKAVASEFDADLSAISIGASIGLFEVVRKNTDLENRLNAWLATHSLFKHATWSLNINSSNVFRESVESLIYANRYQQMQSLSFSPEGFAPAGNEICERDHLRPTTTESKKKLSLSTHARRANGLEKKRLFYRNTLTEHGGARLRHYLDSSRDIPAWDFENISEDSGQRYGNLNGKLAVFYADGNRFSDFAANAKNAGELRDWDTYIRTRRAAMLATVFETVTSPSDTETPLETLLWGGDEIMFVVPAWRGIELAAQFFANTADWAWRDQSGEEQKLTHACGLVFCKKSAPISTIQRLARELAEECKTSSRTDNRLATLVLESFDTAGHSLTAMVEKQYKKKVEFSQLILNSESLQQLFHYMPSLSKTIPKTDAVRALNLLIEQPSTDPPQPWAQQKLLDRSYANIEKSLDEVKLIQFKNLWKFLSASEFNAPQVSSTPNFISQHIAAWSLLLNLWDYTAIEKGISNE